MRRASGLVALAGLLAYVFAQADGQQPTSRPQRPDVQPIPGIDRLRSKLNPEFPAWSPAYVFERVAEHLAVVEGKLRDDFQAQEPGLPPDQLLHKVAYELSYLRYFSLAETPRAYLPAETSALFFTVNDASPAPATEQPRAVPGSDNRLFWIDLRWYCWTARAFEQISGTDPYYREPIIPSDFPALRFVKERIGNGVLRGDWFTYYTGDVSLFLDIGRQKADDAFYYQLLYAANRVERYVEVVDHYEEYETGRQLTRTWRGGPDANGNYFPPGYSYVVPEKRKRAVRKKVYKKVRGAVPQNEREFEEFWGVDPALTRKHYADRGQVVDEGESYVAYQNRVLQRIQAATGVLWKTYDVDRTAGVKDFLEQLPVPPEVYDASEYIFQDMKGAQYYFLSNGKGDRVEFGDPRVVHDERSGEKGIVITFKSCVACHERGIIQMRNEVPLVVASGVRLKAKDPYTAAQLKAFYLATVQRLVQNDQAAYGEFIKDANGLTGEENAEQFKKARLWYAGPLGLTQVARELGADVMELSDAISIATKARIGRLLSDGKAIPRRTWENGAYQETGLLLLEYRKSVQKARKARGLKPLPIRP